MILLFTRDCGNRNFVLKAAVPFPFTVFLKSSGLCLKASAITTDGVENALISGVFRFYARPLSLTHWCIYARVKQYMLIFKLVGTIGF